MKLDTVEQRVEYLENMAERFDQILALIAEKEEIPLRFDIAMRRIDDEES